MKFDNINKVSCNLRVAVILTTRIAWATALSYPIPNRPTTPFCSGSEEVRQVRRRHDRHFAPYSIAYSPPSCSFISVSIVISTPCARPVVLSCALTSNRGHCRKREVGHGKLPSVATFLSMVFFFIIGSKLGFRLWARAGLWILFFSSREEFSSHHLTLRWEMETRRRKGCDD